MKRDRSLPITTTTTTTTVLDQIPSNSASTSQPVKQLKISKNKKRKRDRNASAVSNTGHGAVTKLVVDGIGIVATASEEVGTKKEKLVPVVLGSLAPTDVNNGESVSSKAVKGEHDVVVTEAKKAHKKHRKGEKSALDVAKTVSSTVGGDDEQNEKARKLEGKNSKAEAPVNDEVGEKRKRKKQKKDKAVGTVGDVSSPKLPAETSAKKDGTDEPVIELKDTAAESNGNDTKKGKERKDQQVGKRKDRKNKANAATPISTTEDASANLNDAETETANKPKKPWNDWSSVSFGDSEMTAKFQKLMGIKKQVNQAGDAGTVAKKEGVKSTLNPKYNQKVQTDLEKEYEAARQRNFGGGYMARQQGKRAGLG